MARNCKYRNERDYVNLQKAMFWGAGQYDIPRIAPVKAVNVDRWLSFNYAKTCKEPYGVGIHFFIDDYQFERVWNWPDTYVQMLAKFRAVCSPDFSPYSDFPKIIQLYNHYRKHWCAAYWQSKGMTVIPSITWNGPESLEWAFDGEPVGGVVATSSVGMLRDKTAKEWFMTGYEEMVRRLKPTKIIIKGRVPDELKEQQKDGLICRLPTFTEKWQNTA